MHAIRRLGVLTVALAGLGLLAGGVSGVSALDTQLKQATPRQEQRTPNMMVLDCPRDRGVHRAPASIAS